MNKLKVLLVNGTEKGGAAVIANRLLDALNSQEGVQATMLSATPTTSSSLPITSSLLSITYYLKKALDRLPVFAANGFTMKNLWLTDGGFFGTDITKTKVFKEADVIHLHWVNQGFLSLKDIEKILFSGKRVVWTLHDLWPITGVCHLPNGCEKYKNTGCENCKYLGKDFSKAVFQKKQAIYKQARNVHFIAVSQWVKEQFDSSLLTKNTSLRCDVISNLMPIADFHYERKPRKGDEIVLTMGAARLDNPAKGLPLLLEALRICAADERYGKRLQLILYGGIKDKKLLDEIAIPYIYKGMTPQKEVSDIFCQSDIVLSTSDYETFGATIAEGIACGCITVTRGTGGQRDIVEHLKTGYIVEEGNTMRDTALLFAKGILWAAGQTDRCQQSEQDHRRSRHEEMARRFSPDVIARQHIELYKQ